MGNVVFGCKQKLRKVLTFRQGNSGNVENVSK